MMAFSNSACFFLWAVFLLSYIDAAPAPVSEGDLAQSQALDLHSTEAGSSRCYYNFQHYEEGDRIITNEPCLNCTCHKRMLMCYLRVCPFTKPVGQDCTVEKKPDQCCPVITCPQVPVDIVTSSTTEASSSSSSSAVGHVSKYGCTLEDDTFYPDGVQMPSDPKKPCELCYCIRNHTACVRQECTLNVEGCRPVYQDGVCCPVRYDCDYNEISTTERPSTGGLLLGTTAPSQQCRYGDTLYNDGELMVTDKPCESCYCMRGDIVCAVRSCGEPMEGKNCHAVPPPEGQCCPTTFTCENGTISLENMTTESSIIMHPSPIETDVSTKGPESTLPAEGSSDFKEEETKNEDEGTASSTEILPSVSSEGEETQEDKHEEEKIENHPGENVLSEPTDSVDLDEDEEEASASLSDHLDEVSKTPSPDIGEQFSTSAPDKTDKEVTQSNNVPEGNTSEESAGPSVVVSHAESDQSEKDNTANEQESTQDRVKPDDSGNTGDEGGNATDLNESVTEKQNIVTENPPNQEEISKNKEKDDISHQVSEITEPEVVKQSEGSGHSELESEQDSVPAEAVDKKEEIAPTVPSEGEKSPIEPIVGDNKPITINNIENSQTGSQSTGVEADETKTESNEIGPSGGELTAETEEQREKENETPTTDENEIKYEETPSKTPESLDQVKEAEIAQDNTGTSAGDLSEVHISEKPTDDDNQEQQEVDKSQEKDEAEANAEKPITDESGSAATFEQTTPGHGEHMHKEQAPPRKEDAPPEEIEQRPQHPEGSMTKAEDSIPVGQVLTEAIRTEHPAHSENLDESHKVQDSSDKEEMLVDTTEGSITHDSVDNDESAHDAGQKEEQLQTEQPFTNEASSGQQSENEVNQASEVPKYTEISESSYTTEPETSTDPSDDISGSDETAAVERNPTESPSSESESVPTMIVMEPESSIDSVPEESSHSEGKPEIDAVHEHSSVDEDQSLQTEEPVKTEEGIAFSNVEKQTEEKKHPEDVGEDNQGIENIPYESNQSSTKEDGIEDVVKEDETTTQSTKDDFNSSTNINDNTASSEKEPDGVTHKGVINNIPNKPEEKPTLNEPAPSEASSPEDEKSGPSQSEETEKEELPNEVNPIEDNTNEQGAPTELPVEVSTDTSITSESERNPEEIESESKPVEHAENPKPESELPSEEIHHDPIESEPAEFDENEFAESGDHNLASENEIVDDHLSGHGGAIEHETPSVVPGPVGVIPGEGDCLVDGQTYTNNSIIPSKSPCHKECTCLSSIVHCQGIDCPPPPPELANCMPVHQGDLCCPVYTCDGNTPEGPQSHNQMGGSEENVKGTEDHTILDTDTSGLTSSDSDDKNEMPDKAISSTEKTESAITLEKIADERETQKESNKPVEHAEVDSSSNEDSSSSEESHRENTPQTTEYSVSNVEKEETKPNSETTLEEHKDESGDEKLQDENVTSKTDTLKEDSESKPDSDAESSEKVTNEEEKETQHTVMTDQSETQEAESPEQINTETSIIEESSNKPDEKISESEQDNLSEPSENEQPEDSATETSQASVSETQEPEGHTEPSVKLDTTSETPSELVEEHLPTVTEDESLQSSPEGHVHSEDVQPNKELDSPSINLPAEETVASIENSGDTTSEKTSEHAPDSNDISSGNENKEQDVQEIVTEHPIVGSQDEVVKDDAEVTEDPSGSELLVSSKPSLDEIGQHSESDGIHEESTQSESEDQSKPVEGGEPQTVDGGPETQMNEDTATEMVPRPTENSLEDRKPEDVVPSLDTNDETIPMATGEMEATEERKPQDEHKSEESKPYDEHKVESADIEVVTSHSVDTSEAEENQESNETASLSPGIEEAAPDKTAAPEGAIHDDIDEQNEEVTEMTDELHYGISTEAPYFEGPSTRAPSFEVEHHNEDVPLEESKVPNNTQSPIISVGTIEAGNAPESDNLVTDDKHSLQEETHDQSEETSSSSQDNKSESENNNHEPEETEASKPNDSEISEPTNGLGDHTSEPPKLSLEQSEYGTAQPTHDADKPTDGSPEPLKPENEHEEEESPHNHEDPSQGVHSEEENMQGTERPTEEITNGEDESVDKENEVVPEVVESIENEEGTVTETIEPVQEESEQAHEEPGSAHEDNESTHEESESTHTDNETVHEESQQPHEDPEQTHEEIEQTHEVNQSTDLETESPQIDTEEAHEESKPTHASTEHAQEGNEPTDANLVTTHDGELHHDFEAPATFVYESEQSTSIPDVSENVSQEIENVPQEPELEDVQPTSEIEHPIIETEHPTAESEHADPDSEHVLEPHQQTHEVGQPHEENIIGEEEPSTLETEQGVPETEQTMHEIDIPHKPDSGSPPTMPDHSIGHSKPEVSKPDDPELPPEDQFTPDVDMDYDVSEDGAFGPGTCRYGGKVYVSAQQIPRDDPCDFCFCFRSDIICLQQSCPPPIHRCHQEPIQGYCCPRYQCPVSMATSLNITTTTSTTTTTLPPHFFAHAYRGAARQSGCFHRGRAYEVGEEITSASGPCLQCICGSDGQMQCDPKVCNPEPMVRKLMEAAVSHRRR